MHHEFLDDFDQEVEDDSEQREHEHAGEDQSCVELTVCDQHQVAQALFGADEFADDRADDCKRAGDLQPAEDCGQRIGKPHVPEHLERSAAH